MMPWHFWRLKEHDEQRLREIIRFVFAVSEQCNCLDGIKLFSHNWKECGTRDVM